MRKGPYLFVTAVASVWLALAAGCGSSPQIQVGTGTEPTKPPGPQANANGNGNGNGNGNANGNANGSDDNGSPFGANAGANGTADAGNGGIGEACATGTAATQSRPVYLMLVVDRSGSMDSNSKWTSEVSALKDILNGWITKPPGTWAIGLDMFADPGGSGINSNDSKIEVPLAPMNAAQLNTIISALTAAKPGDLTPTLSAINTALGALEAYKPTDPALAGGKRVILLTTDGQPNPDKPADVITAIQKGHAYQGDASVTTFTVGIGDPTSSAELDPKFIQDAATAGGTTPYNVNPKNASASTSSQFVTAISTIAGQTASCELAIQANGQAFDKGKVNVQVTDNGQTSTVLQDPQNGWTYTDPTSSQPTSITLHGAACDEMKKQGVKVSIQLGCPTEVPH